MNKNILFIGLGILAVGGLAYWYFSKPSADISGTEDKSASSTDTSGGDTPTLPTDMASSLGGKSRKQVRRDCRAEARAQGLRGKAKRQFKRQCKAEGGINADTADFAFNGFDGAFEFS